MVKLNLRDLFWLLLVIAMGLGWWNDHRRQDHTIGDRETVIFMIRRISDALCDGQTKRLPAGPLRSLFHDAPSDIDLQETDEWMKKFDPVPLDGPAVSPK